MPTLTVASASAIIGLAVVGLLLLLEALVRIVAPDWSLPFSAWWGLVAALPGLAAAQLIRREHS